LHLHCSPSPCVFQLCLTPVLHLYCFPQTRFRCVRVCQFNLSFSAPPPERWPLVRFSVNPLSLSLLSPSLLFLSGSPVRQMSRTKGTPFFFFSFLLKKGFFSSDGSSPLLLSHHSPNQTRAKTLCIPPPPLLPCSFHYSPVGKHSLGFLSERSHLPFCVGVAPYPSRFISSAVRKLVVLCEPVRSTLLSRAYCRAHFLYQLSFLRCSLAFIFSPKPPPCPFLTLFYSPQMVELSGPLYPSCFAI